jgi:hypothetical protein
MSQARADATVRARAMLALLVGAALAVLLPTMVAGPGTTSGTAAAVLTLALAALVGLAMLGTALAVQSGATSLPAARAPLPVLAGRVTDPTHHPLRPRAPGSA